MSLLTPSLGIVSYVTSRTVVELVSGVRFGSVFLRVWIWSYMIRCGNIGLLSFAKSLSSNDIQSLTHAPT